MKFKLMQNYEECSKPKQSFHSFVTYVLFGNSTGNALVTERTLYSAYHCFLQRMPIYANPLVFSELLVSLLYFSFPCFMVYIPYRQAHFRNHDDYAWRRPLYDQ